MDLTEKYFSDCSPYINQLTYDLNTREVQLVCVNNAIERVPFKSLKFLNVLEFREEIFEDSQDDSLMDSVVGIYVTQNGSYCLHTEKRELLIRVDKDPISQFIADM